MSFAENRNLIMMPEYRWGGAETQFRAFIDYAQECGMKMDVIITHGFGNYLDELPVSQMSNIGFYEISCEEDLFCFLNDRVDGICYSTCLIYFPKDLHFYDMFQKFGIKVVYSERNDGSEILNNKRYSEILRHCHAVTSNSRYAAARLENGLGVKVITINNGIAENPMFQIKDNQDISNILVPARLDRIKNQMRVLKFLKGCDERYRVKFAGRAQTKSYYLKMKHYIEDNGLTESVEICGDTKNMDELYGWADLVLLPSLCEGTPNVVLETYMLGRPVIAANIEAERGLIDSRFLYDVRDEEGIAKCISVLREMSFDEYSRIIYKNRKTVLEEYSMKQMCEKYADLMASNGDGELLK
jgi:glycosyltransferase involved in cell wall biosynthesis